MLLRLILAARLIWTAKDDARVDTAKSEAIRYGVLHLRRPGLRADEVEPAGSRVRVSRLRVGGAI